MTPRADCSICDAYALGIEIQIPASHDSKTLVSRSS
jgi:hypothetical protein